VNLTEKKFKSFCSKCCIKARKGKFIFDSKKNTINEIKDISNKSKKNNNINNKNVEIILKNDNIIKNVPNDNNINKNVEIILKNTPNQQNYFTTNTNLTKDNILKPYQPTNQITTLTQIQTTFEPSIAKQLTQQLTQEKDITQQLTKSIQTFTTFDPSIAKQQIPIEKQQIPIAKQQIPIAKQQIPIAKSDNLVNKLSTQEKNTNKNN
jgi:hypothetical protein